MFVNGCNCSIIIKTSHIEKDIPYSDETIRETVSILQEEAAIEGNGVCSAMRKKSGFTGCVVTPLTIGTAPLLLYLVMGAAGKPVFVSGTRNLYLYDLSLLPMEDCDCFDLIQDRGGERLLYEGCGVLGFEMRIMRGETLQLKIDIKGERSPRVYPYTDTFEKENGECFKSDFVTYEINGREYTNIYGLTINTQKGGGTRTEIWIKRVIEKGIEIPEIIEDMVITAQLQCDRYEYRHFGVFRITLKRLVMMSDETKVNSFDAVIGPLRFYVSGTVTTEVFISNGELIA